jgi:hypothetical protein
MKRVILILAIMGSIFPTLFAQGYGVVWASYADREYMDTLNGRTPEFPANFVKAIERFEIISYEQSSSYSKNSFLKSVIDFTCRFINIEEFTIYNEYKIHLNIDLS